MIHRCRTGDAWAGACPLGSALRSGTFEPSSWDIGSSYPKDLCHQPDRHLSQTARVTGPGGRAPGPGAGGQHGMVPAAPPVPRWLTLAPPHPVPTPSQEPTTGIQPQNTTTDTQL